jgi:arylsulfatase A-like enzyme
MLLLPLMLASCSFFEPAPASVAAPEPPDVVLVVIDTLRADHLSIYGHARPTSPNIDALAGGGTWWHRAYAGSGWTLASFATLLTGQHAFQHRVGRDPDDPKKFGRLGQEVSTLPELLGAQGYSSAAFMNNAFLAGEFGLQQGFDPYDWRPSTNQTHRTADQTVVDALAWKATQTGPSFSLLHFMEPHMEYSAPEDVRGTFASIEEPRELVARPGEPDPYALMHAQKFRPTADAVDYMKARYDEEIFTADRAIGALVEGLKALPRWSQTLVIITSDHGEEFWEHGRFEHGHALNGELTRVPLVIGGPAAPKQGRIDTVVQHVDLFQGLLGRAGIARPAGTGGEDLFIMAVDDPLRDDRAALSENCLYGPPCLSLVDKESRLLFDMGTGMGQVFAVAPDGSELVRLNDEQQMLRGSAMIKQLQARRGSLDPVDAVAGPEVPDAATFQQLAALGYLDGISDEE